MIEIGIEATDGKFGYLFYEKEHLPSKAGWVVEPRYNLVAFFDNNDDRHKFIYHKHKKNIKHTFVTKYRVTQREYKRQVETAINEGVFNVVPDEFTV